MIRDVAELLERGQVERRVAELDVDVDTWRKGMRAAARREGMRIRTFLAEPADPPGMDARPDPAAEVAPGTVVVAVRIDRSTGPDQLAAVVDAIGPSPELLARLNRPPADVVSLEDRRADARPTDGRGLEHD